MPVDIPRDSSPLEPGEPVPADAVTQQGSTFAARAAAAKKVASKAVQSDDDGDAENKAVAKKSAAKS